MVLCGNSQRCHKTTNQTVYFDFFPSEYNIILWFEKSKTIKDKTIFLLFRFQNDDDIA